MKSHSSFAQCSLFESGFRLFFLLAVFSALGSFILWQTIKDGALMPDSYFEGEYWHAHEMLFGYGMAVIAGFLLTAVNHWAGRVVVDQRHLVALGLLWLYGRIVPFYAGSLPDELIATIDMAFVPALAMVIGRLSFELNSFRALAFTVLLGLLTIGNALIHAEMLGIYQATARLGIQLVLMAIYLLLLIMAGRIFPVYAERAMTGIRIPRYRQLDYIAVGSALLFFIGDLLQLTSTIIAVFALIAAVANGWRLVNWFVFRVCFIPMLWILYLGYAWLVVGFVLSAFSMWSWINSSFAMHAFALGGIGVLTMGMMARMVLTHTGRSLQTSTPVLLAFALINLAVVCRVIIPIFLTSYSEESIYLAILAWLAAFALFLFDYTPMFFEKK
jgi:uncharacterized protein involved in response to NO